METIQNFDQKTRCSMYEYIHSHCNPSVDDWDDDASGEEQDALRKITHQVYDKVDKLDKYIRDEEE